MQTRVTEVADGVHHLTTVIPDAPVAFNHYLIAAAERLDIGGHVVQWFDTRTYPTPEEAGVLYDITTRRLSAATSSRGTVRTPPRPTTTLWDSCAGRGRDARVAVAALASTA